MTHDPVKVDSKHYTVEFENDDVRVIRIRYAPGEKSKMHGHPKSVAVFLTDCEGRFTFPDGKSENFNSKAGQTMFMEPTEQLSESRSKNPFELLQIELKH